MGLFSRKTIVSVASVIYPLGEEPDKIPDFIQAAVIAAGMRGSSRSQAIKDAIFDGAGLKLSQGFQYASKHYYAGLPDGYVKTVFGEDDQFVTNDGMLEVLCEEYLALLYPGQVVDVKSTSVQYGTNHDTIARQLIETAYNYDFYEEAVHTAFGSVAVDATLEYVPLDQDLIAHPNDLGYRLTFTNPNNTTFVTDVWYPRTQFEGQTTVQNRIIMEVVIDGAPAITLFYTAGGADPRLNIFLRSQGTPTSQTFPAIVLKKANNYLDTNAFHKTGPFTNPPYATTEAYKTSVKYGQILGVDILDLINKLRDNPDEGKIDYAFLQPGTLITSPNLSLAKYHFNYFFHLYSSFPDNKPAYEAWVAARSYPNVDYTHKNKATNCPAQSIRITDPDDTRNSVNMEIAWRYMTYEVKTGTLPKSYVVECGPQEEVRSRYAQGRGLRSMVTYDVTKLYLRKRLTPTTYAELCICGLWHENYVYKEHSVQSGIWDMFNDPEGDFGTGFLIPLQYDILMALSGRDRLQIAQEAYHLVLNCYKVQKQKWYQTGIFKVFMFIVAIVVIVWSWGSLTEGVLSLYSAVSGAVGAVAGVGASLTVIAAISAVITGMIVGLVAYGVTVVAREAGQWAAEQWGAFWGALVQIAVTVALTWGIGAGLEGFTSFQVPPIGLAESVLQGASLLMAGLATYTEAELAKFREDQARWMDYINSPNNPLEEVNKLLEELFPDMNLVQQAASWPLRETMDEFLGRTLSMTDGLTNRLFMPISHMTELTLTPRLV